MSKLVVLDTGLQAYLPVLHLQEQLFEENLKRKQRSEPTQNTLILCTHFPVYTLGKNASTMNLLAQKQGYEAEVIPTQRGGDVTFHGPGQAVAYPIFDLESLHIGLAQYIHLLETCVIETLQRWKVPAFRLKEAPGIWVNSTDGTLKKICAVGVKASRFVTMHGIALNLHTDLQYFHQIVPCGIADKGVTRLCDETTLPWTESEVKEELVRQFEKQFKLVG